jgi:hypothetical protein
MNLKSRNKETSEKNTARRLFLMNLQGSTIMYLFKKCLSNLDYLINLENILTDALCTISQLWICANNRPMPQYQPARAWVNKFL